MLKAVWEWNRDAQGIAVFVAGIAAGGIIAAAPNLAFGTIYPGSRTTLVGWAVCSLGLSLLRPTWAIAGVALSFPAFSGLMGALEGANLFPIAMILSFAISGPPAVVGGVVGVALRRFVPRNWVPATMLVAAGVVVAVRPVLAIDAQVSAVLATNEAGALDRLAAMVEAQRDYQLQNSSGLYACSFDDLNQTLERRETEPPFRDIGWASGYRFRLSCTDQTRTTFHLTAQPERREWNVRVPPTGETTFCTDETGQLLSIPAVARRSCWEDGTPVSSG